MTTTPAMTAAAHRDPCDPSSLHPATATSTALCLPPPPVTSTVPLSILYPSQQQSRLHGGAAVKLSQAPAVTPVSDGNAASHSKAVKGGGSIKRTTSNVKPLSTQERMSMFMEHTVASGNKLTPRIVIRKDAKFKSACNKIRWLNKASEAATTSADNRKRSSASSEDKTANENGSQFYSFHEKADPSLDESVNPPIKLPTALLVRDLSLTYMSVAIYNLVVWQAHVLFHQCLFLVCDFLIAKI